VFVEIERRRPAASVIHATSPEGALPTVRDVSRAFSRTDLGEEAKALISEVKDD